MIGKNNIYSLMSVKHSHLSPRYFILIFTLILSACGGGGSSSDSAFSNPPSFSTDYKNDELDFMDTELRRSHPDLFFHKSQSAYETDLATFRSASSNMTDLEFSLEMAKFIAELGDQHTYIALPIDLMRKYPVKIWWDNNRAIVIETNEAYRQYLGQELVSIDGTPLWELKDVGMRYLAYQNEAWKDALSPRFIHLAGVLYNEGVTSNLDFATFVFEDTQGQQTTLDINSLFEIRDWVRVESLQPSLPLYRLSEDNYFHTVENDNLYIQYNSASSIPGYSLTNFISDLESALNQNEINRIIVDLRFNYGGAIDHFVPVVQFLSETSLNTQDSLFVLTGRNTFSSAVGAIYSFKNMTQASFVGGPSGGKPNGFSHVVGFSFRGSLNALYMSTHYLAVADGDPDSFYPEHSALFTQQDFINGQDPAIHYILQNWP